MVIILLLALLIGGGLYYGSRPKPAPQPPAPVTPAVVPTPPPPAPEPIKDTVHFAFDRSWLSAKEKAELKAFWEKVNGKAGQLTISGYTCNLGPDWYNQHLSERRAKSVAKFLDVPETYAVKMEANGKSDPVADNDTREGRRANRRAELVFTPAR